LRAVKLDAQCHRTVGNDRILRNRIAEYRDRRLRPALTAGNKIRPAAEDTILIVWPLFCIQGRAAAKGARRLKVSNGEVQRSGGLTNGASNGPLIAPASSQVGGNGVYTYSTGFPNQTWQDSNYYVDVSVHRLGADADADAEL
jgi:hypothetical protein